MVAAGPGRSLGERFRERFGRRTSSTQFIAEIDGLRFPAIAIVVLGHLAAFFIDRPGAPAARGALDAWFVGMRGHAGEGVVLFFVISGFVLALPFARMHLEDARPVSLRDYYLRRVTRLEPPYLISLFAFLLLKIAGRKLHLVAGAEPTSVLVEHFVVSAAYLHNLVYGTGSIINGVAWSLEVEIQFYLLVPLLTQVFRVRRASARRTVIAGVAVLAIVLQQTVVRGEGRLSLSVLGSLQYFLMGFLLADLYLGGEVATASRRGWWDLVTLAAWPLIFALWTGAAATPVFLPLVSLVAFIAVFRGRITNAVFTNPWITTFGGMCYSIYLLHFMLIGTAGKVVLRGVGSTGAVWRDVVVQGAPLLLVALAGSVIFYVAIERPCMDRRWPSRLVRWVRGRLGGVSVAYVGESET
jgi:peptidoglycan/LPS O-acetylase OafA/YrhL